MSAAEIDGDIIRVLRSIDTSQHIGLFLGAGASAASGLPDWDSFSINVLTDSGAIQDSVTAKAFLAGQDPAIVAEAAKEAAGDRWSAVLKSSLYGSEPVSPAPLHYAAAVLAEHCGPDAITLFTLNYDDLLEVALREVLDAKGKRVEVCSRQSQRPRARGGSYEVQHLHGFMPPGSSDAHSVILTLSDYNKLGENRSTWQSAALADSLSKGPLVLAGTSYRDPDVRQWIHDLAPRDEEPQVLVFLAREGLKLNRAQFEHVRAALERQWSALGVRVIATHDYSDAAHALLELPYIYQEDYRPPKDRAAILWEHHLENFAGQQREDSEELEGDLQKLQELKPDVANLTLWLANGDGELVRWSSHDRIYRHAEALRRVRPGHDSDWIAAQCIGRNDFLVRDVPQAGSTTRWLSVFAAPIGVRFDVGPQLPCGVITAASVEPSEGEQLDEFVDAFSELSEKWALLLEMRTGIFAAPSGERG
ncbi:SIR2 family protein [Rhodococcus sp. NPDC060090]|uniref:SIR2 family protein n=1 Tax=Rhodococcus sp. NPDC060090 TaxID=3347056 RepID=UPI003650C482